MIGDAFSYLTTGSHWGGSSGILYELGQQMLLTITALLIAMLVGLPIALVLGHLGRGGFLAINISNIGRAVPTFAVLILLSVGPIGTGVLGPYGRAGLATLIALTLFALPPIITNSYVGMREVDKDTVESARGMGMTGRQLFAAVELPLALPLILTGLRLALVQVWATATIAALVAGPGLGNIITDGFRRSDYGEGLGGALVVAAVALVLEGLAALTERYVDPLSRTRRRVRRRVRPDVAVA
jgi:osmoprotectant transport system permease protein